MGFYKENYKQIEFLLENSYIKEGFSVVEFGSQDLVENREGNSILDSGRISARLAYEYYGCNNYECIDLEGYHGAYRYDLGKDLVSEYGYNKQFDIVTCKDVGHWIFNQEKLFANLHNLCKKKGIIVWCSPLGGGFAQGWYSYHHYKILQLVFANNYLLLGGGCYLTEYLHRTSCGKFKNFDRKEAEKINMRNAGEFVQAVEEYMGRDDSWRYVSLERGLPSVSASLVFLKQDDEHFNVPIFYYDKNERVIKRNAKSVLQNCFPAIKKGKVAIFGAAYAGELAKIFADEAGIEVLCFIDDNKEGFYKGKEIVNVEYFNHFLSDRCDFILVGPSQKGDVSERVHIKVCRLYEYWFVG